YFNVFGPRQDPKSPYSGVISVFVDRALSGATPRVFGDGTQSRDFVFVTDVVDANLRAATRTGVAGGVFNVGRGERTTLNELLQMLGRIVEREIAPEYGAARGGDIRESLADIARARAELGYAPAVGVEEGLGRLVAYERARRSG